MVKRFKALFTISVILLSMTAGWAATKTWVGGDLTKPTDWDTPGNWTPAGVPNAGDNVIINSGVNQPVIENHIPDTKKVEIHSIEVKTGATLKIIAKQRNIEFIGTSNFLISGQIVLELREGTVRYVKISNTDFTGSPKILIDSPLTPLINSAYHTKLEASGNIHFKQASTITADNYANDDKLIINSPKTTIAGSFTVDSKLEIKNSSGVLLDITGTFTAKRSVNITDSANTIIRSSVEQSDGTLLGGTVNLTENLTLNNATWTTSEGEVKTKGNFEVPNFKQTGGTLKLEGTSTQNLKIDKAHNLTFTGNVVLDKPLIISGNFTANGDFDAGTRSVTFNGAPSQISGSAASHIVFTELIVSGSKALAVTKDITIKERLTNEGTFTAAGKTVKLEPSSGLIKITGTNTAAATTFGILSLRNTGGKTLEIGGKITADDLNISGTPSNKLTVQGVGTSSEITLTSDQIPDPASKKGYYLKVNTNIPVRNGHTFYIANSELVEPKSSNWKSMASTWKTTTGSDNWNVPANWTPAAVPTADWPVIIPAGGSGATYPKLNPTSPFNPAAQASSVTVETGAKLDLGAEIIRDSGTGSAVTAHITNNGMLKMIGTTGNSSNPGQKEWLEINNSVPNNNNITHGPGSTIEYYGNTNNAVWTGPYKNLTLSDGRTVLTPMTQGASPIAAPLAVEKTFTVASNAGNNVTVSAASQSYGGTITLNKKTTFNSSVASGTGTVFNNTVSASGVDIVFSGNGPIQTKKTVTARNITVNSGTGAWTSTDTINASGDITVNSGTGAWTSSGGTINARDITVYRGWTANSVVLPGRDLTVEGTWSSNGITAGRHIIARGNWTSNAFVMTHGNITADNATHSNTWTAGDVTLKGSLTAAQFNQTSGTLTFNGTGTPEQELNFTGAGNKNIRNLTVDNGITPPASNAKVKLLSSVMIAGNFTNKGTFNANGKDISLDGSFTNSGIFNTGTGNTVTFRGASFTNSGTFTAGTNNTVNLSPSGDIAITGTGIAGNTKFHTLKLTNAGGKTLTINGKITVDDLNISGTSSASKLTVQGSSPSDFNIELTSDQIPDPVSKKGYYLDVKRSVPINDGYIYYVAQSGLDTPNPKNWQRMAYTWKTAAATTTWDNSANWTPKIIPTADWPVIIPAGANNYPILVADTSAKSVTVEANAELTLGNSVIKKGSVTAKLTNYGTIKMTGTNFQAAWFGAGNDDKIDLKPGSTVEYYGTSTANVWEGPYQKLKISGARQNLNASSLTVNTDLITARSPVVITTSGKQTYHGNVIAFEEVSSSPPTYTYYDLTLANTGTGTIKTSRGVTTGNLTVNGHWEAGDQNNSATVEVNGNLNVSGDIASVDSSIMAKKVSGSGGNITVNGTNDWRCWGDITAEDDMTIHNMTATGGTIAVHGNMTAHTFHLADYGKLYFNGSGSQNLNFTDTVDSQIRELEIGSSSILNLGSSIKITHILTNKGRFTAGNHTVTLSKADRIDNSDPNTVPPTRITITGTSAAANTQFKDLICTDSYIKKLTIDKKISVTGNMTLQGSGAADNQLLTIDGGASTGSESPEIALTGNQSGKFLKVRTNIPVTGGTYTAESSVPYMSATAFPDDPLISDGNPTGWIFTNYNGNLTWKGSVDSDWHNRRNWNPPLAVPGKDTVVTIPRKAESAHRYPLLAGNAEANTVTVQANASLDIAGFVIDDSSGRSPLTVHGMLQLKGTADQKNWFTASAAADKIKIESGSTVVYYDNSTADIWGGPYYRLQARNRDKLVTGGLPLTVDSTFTVSHTTPSATLEIDTGAVSQTYRGDIAAGTNNLKFTASLLTTMNTTSRNIKAANITVTGNWDNSARITAKTIEVQGSSGLQSDIGDILVSGDFTASKFIQNRGNLTFNGTGTQTLSANSADSKINNLVINQNASVKLGSDITIKGNFTNNGSFDARNTGSPPGYTVTLTNDSNHDITGSSAAAGTKFYNLVCVNAGGRQIRFNKNISVYGNLTLRGSAANNVLNLSGTNPIENPPGTPNPAHSGTIYINANKNPSEPDNCKWLGVATNLPIASLDSNTYTCTASESAPTGNFEQILPLLMAGHPKNWIFTDVKNLAWTGETNTDWDNPGNWRPRPSAAPTGNQYVTIRKTTVNRPVLGSGTYYAKEVDVRGTAALDLADNVIYTSGTLTAKLTTAGTLKLKGTPAQKNWFTASDANKIRLDMTADTTTVVYYGGSSMPSTAADIWTGPYKNLEINGGKTKLHTAGDLTVKRDFTVKTETQLSAAGKISVEGKTAIEAPASLQADGADAIKTKDMFINAPAASVINFKSPLNAASFVLYGGEVKLSAPVSNTPDIQTADDIVLFGSSYTPDDASLGAHGTGLFTYNNGKRSGKTASPSLILNVPPSCSGKFSDLSGKTLKVGKNFYANGTVLEGTSEWTLQIPNNDSALAAFAEAYSTNVKNAKAQGGTVAAAEGCNPSGTNTGWDFTRPTIQRAYTVWDDVIRLEFSEPIENSNDEISTALAHIKLNNGMSAFSGAYTDKNGTISTNGKGDLSTFYLKSSVRWNTDAMGTNAGNGQSTDMGRSASAPPANRSVIPDLDIPKALAAVYETLRDKNKNRITDYSGINRFTAVQDNCPPVLIGVYTGQEMHTPHNGSGTGGQPEYDAHNFIEFRYSEPVNIYENTTDGAAIALSDSAVNIRSTNTLGNIGPNGSGLKIAGFADIASGSLSAASRDGGIPHALYRKFPAAHGSAAAAQTHRVRISIAGFADGTKTVGAYTVHNWVGYIDNAVTPSGNAVPPGNDKFAENGLIRSAAVFDPDGTGPLPAKPVFSVKGEYVPIVNTALNVPLDTGNLHGSWDTSAPVFARYAKDESGWISSSLNEIIGFAPSNIVEKLEFHFFDNAPSYTAGETFRWQSTDGVNEPAWFQGASSLAGTSYDKLGGSRFDPNGTAPTEGGIRASSLSGSIGAFGFRKKGSSGALIGFTGGDTDIRQKADSGLLFRPIPSGRNPVDTLYLQLDIQGAPALALPITQAFSVEYDQSVGFVTDLAGNRMRTQSAESIDLTRPRIVLSIAPVGTDKVYILFNTPINTDAAHLAGIPHNLAIDNSTNTFDTSKPAQVRTLTDSGTGLILHLSNRIVYNDIKKPIRIRVSSASSPPNKMFIERTTLNLAPVIGPAHALSDFAVNVVRPLYVHDDGPGGEEGFQSLANGLAMRLFDGSGGPGNTAFADKDLTIAAARENGDADKLQMYYDTDPRPESVSVAFNLATGLKSRVWLPKRLDAISFAANSSAPPPLDMTLSGASSVFSNPGQPLNFPPDKTVEFLFGLERSGSLITIDHDADGTTATPTPEVPLYALRLKDPNDPASIDLWSFNTSALKPQAGGVSILNNVINVGSDEKCTVNVTVEKAGSLSVMVMTLDGDVVKVLHSGRAEKGSHLYRWNGTNKSGTPVARGMYFIRVIGPGIDETRKVMAVKE